MPCHIKLLHITSFLDHFGPLSHADYRISFKNIPALMLHIPYPAITEGNVQTCKWESWNAVTRDECWDFPHQRIWQFFPPLGLSKLPSWLTAPVTQRNENYRSVPVQRLSVSHDQVPGSKWKDMMSSPDKLDLLVA